MLVQVDAVHSNVRTLVRINSSDGGMLSNDPGRVKEIFGCGITTHIMVNGIAHRNRAACSPFLINQIISFFLAVR